MRTERLISLLCRDWSVFAFSEKVSDPDGAKHPEGRSGHRGQTPFPQLLCCRGIRRHRALSRREFFLTYFLLLLSVVECQAQDLLLKLKCDAPTASTFAMDFSNDGKSFAAAGLDKVIRIWNVSDLTTTAHLTPPRQIHLWNGTGTAGLIYSVDFSPDDRLLGVATNFGGFLISPETGDIVASLTIPTIAERLLNFHSMAFSPDGKWMATGHNKSLRFWHLESVRTQVESGPLPSEVASQISNQLKGRHQVLRAHDLMPETGVMSVSFCQDSNGALFALSAAGDTTPIVWEESNGVWRKSYTLTCEGPTYTAKFLGIPSRVVTASENRTVAYWDHR